jgi:hypothetical protein
MINKHFIFLAGHHRSGTSLLHEIIREHPLVSGFSRTGAPEDEGQHLQRVYEPAKTYGGPGKYIFNPNSYMNEHHALATEQSAKAILEQWEKHYDTKCAYYIEKSPPNIIRTRFLQKLYPNSKFVIILRHPLAIAYAIQKWSKTPIKSLIEHTLIGYEIFIKDMPHLNNVYIFRYEDFVANPQEEINKIYYFLNLEPIPMHHTVYPKVNDKYFATWENNSDGFSVDCELEKRVNRFGYSVSNCRDLLPISFLGAHINQAISAA